MPDFGSLEEYAEYAEKLSLEQLIGILNYIDREEFPERYNIIEDIINEKKQAASIEGQSMQPQIPESPAGLKASRNIYFLLIALILLGEPVRIFTKGLDIEQAMGSLVTLSLYSIIFYGLVKVKNWVVILILVVAYLGLAALFIDFIGFQDAEDPILIVRRIFGLFLAIFWGFQIILFSKKRTRAYFKEKGTILII